jgi:energy-coupling factor transport system ATP-binding protein
VPEATTSIAAAPTPRAAAPPSQRLAVELDDVGHVYDDRTPWAHRALAHVDLRIEPGEGVVIEGANGSGKTTLAWIIAGLTTPTEGIAMVDGEPAEHARHAGLCFQHARLQLQRSRVRDEVRDASGASDDAVDDALRAVQLDPDEFGDRSVDMLSGGEQRRVAIAGMLAQRREVLVLDEPFAGLDPEGVAALGGLLAELRHDRGLTIVVVSHDDEGVDRFADRRVRLERGCLVADDKPVARRNDRAVEPAPRRRRSPGVHLFRVLPEPGPLHRTTAATKLVGIVAVGIALAVFPRWSTILVMSVMLTAGYLVGRVPWSARPVPPRWFAIALGLGFAFSLLAGGAPSLHVGGASIGFGALFDTLRVTLLALLILATAALVSWTTPLAEVAPALRWLTQPLAKVGLPVAEWSFATAIAMRGLPLLLDEVRTLAAARALRSHRPIASPRELPAEGLRLLIAVSTVTARRAREFADAIEARGGVTPPPVHRPRFSWHDLAVLVVVAAAIAAAALT